MILDGMHLPLTTPFFPDGRLNLRKLEQNLRHYSLTPAAGMLLLGPSGEAGLLTDTEKDEVLRVAIQAASASKVMLAEVACEGVRAALQRIETAASLQYDVAVLSAPHALALTPAELSAYFVGIADRSPLPLVLAGGVPLDLLAELGFHPRILGCVMNFPTEDTIRQLLRRTETVKHTVTVTQTFSAVTARMAAAQAAAVPATILSAESLTGGGTAIASPPSKPALKTRTKVVGFQILVAGTERMLPGLLAGAVGAVPPFAAAAPQGCYEVMAAWKDGDTPLAEEKQSRLMDAVRLVEQKFGIAGIKYGCDLNGYFGGAPRLPLLPLLGQQKTAMEHLMQGLRS